MELDQAMFKKLRDRINDNDVLTCSFCEHQIRKCEVQRISESFFACPSCNCQTYLEEKIRRVKVGAS